jgi:hypothetical protein
VPGWNLHTKGGREAAYKFLVELTMSGMAIASVFGSLFVVSAKDEFGIDLVQEVHGEKLKDERFKAIARVMENFEPIARRILAGRRGKLVLVQSED